MHATTVHRARDAAAAAPPDIAELELEFPAWVVVPPPRGTAPWRATRSRPVTAEQHVRGARESVTAPSLVLLRDELLVETEVDQGARRVLLA